MVSCIRFIYDLQIPRDNEASVIPKPLDGEVDSFKVQ